MRRLRDVRKRGFAFAITATLSVVVSSGMVFGMPSLFALLKDEETILNTCNANGDPSRPVLLVRPFS